MSLFLLAFGALMAASVLLVAVVLLLLRKKSAAPRTTVYESIQQMRSIGELSVFKVLTKEIVTETDHTWGEFGEKYLGWVISGKKMAMIFEFDIDFRYDLRSADFDISETRARSFVIRMPPCFYEAHIRDIRFYDEQRSRFMPWLLPDLLNGFLSGGFSEADKNRLIAAAKGHAEQQALALIGDHQSDVQNSARTTLKSISKAFGAEDVEFEFQPQGEIKLDVGMAGRLVA